MTQYSNDSECKINQNTKLLEMKITHNTRGCKMTQNEKEYYS